MSSKCRSFSVVCMFVMLVSSVFAGADTEPIGWATLGGGTTGGEGGQVVTVTNKAEFTTAVSGDTPRIVQVVGTIHGDNIVPNVGSNKTILGVGYDAQIVGFSVKVTDLDNVIVRNLSFHGAVPQDGLICRRATHIWVDHCTFFDAADGQLDFSDQCDYVTVSWCKFYYTSKINDHRLACLVGSTDDNAADVGKLNITWHHNWWGNYVDQRMPRVRYGKNHIFNNYYSCENNYYCVGGSWGFQGLVENNYFDHVRNPIMDAGTTNSGSSGSFTVEIKSVGNIFDGCSGSMSPYGSAFVPNYLYQLDRAVDIPSIVQENAGTTILAGDSALWPSSATVPSPESGKTYAGVDSTLTWRAGSSAVSHNVYFGTDAEQLVSYGNQSGTSFTPPTLQANTQYYWRIDEVATDESVVTGDVWTFRTAVDLPAEVVHYWPFDVDFFDAATVFASNPNNPFGAAWLDYNNQLIGAGCLDCTYEKDGLIAGWADSSTNTMLPAAAPMTVSIWFKPTELPASDKTGCMFGTKSGTETSAKNFRIEILPTGGCRLTVDTDTPEFGNQAMLNQWNHISVAVNSSGLLRAWLNADEEGSITLQTNASNNYNGQYAGIGFYGDNANGLHRGDYTGYIDEIVVWNVFTGHPFAELLYNNGIGKTILGPAFTGEPQTVDVAELSPYEGLSLTNFAFDLNGISTVYFDKVSGPGWMCVSKDGTVSGIPANEDVGQNVFQVKVTDQSGLYDIAQMTINVSNVYSGVLGMVDLEGMTNQWLDNNCGLCSGSDIDGDNKVDLSDFAILSDNWNADESLLLNLEFEQMDTDTTDDGSVYDRVCVLEGNPAAAKGHTGDAIELDGIDDYVRVSGWRGIGGGASRTCCMWFKTAQAPGCLLSWGGLEGGTKWYVRLQPDGEFRVQLGAGGYTYGSSILNDDQWHHAAVVIDDDGSVIMSELKLYVDGRLETVADASSKSVDVGTDYEVQIGAFTEGGGTYFNGLIDDVRVYNRALDQNEIQALVR